MSKETMVGQRRFRFGAVAGFGRSGQEWAATARHIEQLGFATLLRPDGTGTFAPFQALSAAAAVTSTLRLGTYVLASPLRTPGEVAWESASLDVLSGGRFELGLGADPRDLIRHGSITVLVGSARQMADTLLRRRDRAAVSYVSLNAQFADRFAPVIELLADA
jgi:hypothetical protein